MTSREYPKGEPIIITDVDNLPWTKVEDCKYKGFIFCYVLPPKKLFPPLLHYSCKDGRLVFPLCAKCSDQEAVSCVHTDADRGWVMGYTHAEILKALELGYIIQHVYEIWHYNEWTSDDINSPKSLFGSYIKTFMKLKIEKSGWPEELNDNEKEKYIKDLFENCGVEIEEVNVESNPVQRTIGKLLNNSLWGKLAQRSEVSHVKFINDIAKLQELMNNPNQFEVVDLTKMNEEYTRVTYKIIDEDAIPELSSNCLPVACFVTAYGRLQLYQALEKVEGKLLYCDTDSVIYATKGPELPESPYLGGLNREMPQRKIIEFVAAGPKNYGLLHTDANGGNQKADVKIRGVKLNYSTAKLLNFHKMKEIIMKDR